MATAYQFPFDPSGTSSTNRITNEQHVITAQNFRDYHYVIPKFAPFFEGNFTIRLQFPDGSVRDLTYGVDYYFSNQFLDASRACSKPVFGSISFLDTDTQGILSISYNTVGDKWNITAEEITRILAEEMRNPRITTWEQITYLPERFPVVDHEWDLIDMVGASDVVTAINDVRAAIAASSGTGLTDHINNYSNPHNTTKDQVGLGNVQNYPVASQAASEAGTSNAFYMTPLTVKYAINVLGQALVDAHANRTDNPHGTTKAQIGLGNVPNYAGATQAQAEAGAIDTALMTPLRTAQAIQALAGSALASHTADTNNPHNVTKDQIGLFNVQNYPVATQQEALNGTANDRYMTPLRTTQLVTEFVTTQLDGHATRTDNPHQTTAAQVGLGSVANYAIATQAEAQAGVSNVKYMTPGRTADAINALGTPRSHMDDMANPHEVTADQIGTYTSTQIDTALAGYVRTNDTNWVAGMTKSAFLAEVYAGTIANATNAANSAKLEGKTYSEVVADIGATIGTSFAVADSKRSRDAASTPDPVATPYRWIVLGTVDALAGTGTEITSSNPDAYWFVSGGHKQESTAALNAAASSPAYLVRAKNGLDNTRHTVDVTRLNGTADSDVQFGWTYDAGTFELTIWMRVSYAYNNIAATQLSSFANALSLETDTTVVEPTGITYVTPTGFVSSAQHTALADRVTAIETTLNSITVA